MSGPTFHRVHHRSLQLIAIGNILSLLSLVAIRLAEDFTQYAGEKSPEFGIARLVGEDRPLTPFWLRMMSELEDEDSTYRSYRRLIRCAKAAFLFSLVCISCGMWMLSANMPAPQGELIRSIASLLAVAMFVEFWMPRGYHVWSNTSQAWIDSVFLCCAAVLCRLQEFCIVSIGSGVDEQSRSSSRNYRWCNRIFIVALIASLFLMYNPVPRGFISIWETLLTTVTLVFLIRIGIQLMQLASRSKTTPEG